MIISVCMATYNGALFIKEQLNTILRQTRQPDEVIICDDCSQDNTVQIVQSFIEENHLETSWKLIQNHENKGYPGNFYYAMSLCEGDVIFLSDQDDIWNEEKIEKMCVLLEERADISVLSCSFGLIDAKGQRIQTVMHSGGRGKDELRCIPLQQVFYKYEWPGMVLAFRREWYFQWACRMDTDCKVPHDFLLCVKASEEGGLWQMEEMLAYQRRHDNNVGLEEHRIHKLLNKPRKLQEIESYIRHLEGLYQADLPGTKEGKEILNQKMEAMRGRLTALQSCKIRQVLANAWMYRQEVRFATMVCDVLIVRGK